jgi:hypothetical protein
MIQSAAEDAEIRDGKQAVADSRRACELTDWSRWEPIAMLAAASAESGDFAAAVKWQTKALTLVTEKEIRAILQITLKKYRQRIPLRIGPDLEKLFPARA